jgi:hypothetical protein
MTELQNSKQVALYLALLSIDSREELFLKYDTLTPEDIQQIRTLAYYLELGFAFSEQV